MVGELQHKSWWLELCPPCSALLRVGEEHMENSLQTVVLERESGCRGVNSPSPSSEEQQDPKHQGKLVWLSLGGVFGGCSSAGPLFCRFSPSNEDRGLLWSLTIGRLSDAEQ